MGTAIIPEVIADFKQSKGVIGSINYCSCLGCGNETHIITDPTVPFVGQGNDSFCADASTAMQINYLGFNTTLPEILHDVGYGYLRMYMNILPGASRLPSGGSGIAEMDYNMKVLAEIYNVTFRDFSLEREPDGDSLWDRYYEKMKELINADIPIHTSVDPWRLTFYNEHFNVSNDTTGGHAIVIVGYNETNNTICYNDPFAAEMNVSGSYLWEDQDVFKTAVEGTNGYYKIYVFYKQNHTENPTRQERFEKVHDLNILRLQGDFKYYFGVDIDLSDLPFLYQLFFRTCYHLGINATEKQKIDINGPVQRLRTLSLYKQYETTLLSPYYFYYDVFQQLENVSTYLLEQQNLSPLCLHDGLLLKQESTLWKKLVSYYKEIQETNINNSLIKTLMLTNPLFDEMVKTLDEIIDIEQQILNNNLKKNIDFHRADKNNLDITGLS
jgi:hypothetical protein